MQVLQLRSLDHDLKVDSTFIQVAPTLRTLYLVENSPTLIKFVGLNQTRDIPYCETFDVEECWVIESPREGAKACVVKQGIRIIWKKRTMMKSLIRSNQEGESRKAMNKYQLMFGQYPFIEREKPAYVEPPQELLEEPVELL